MEINLKVARIIATFRGEPRRIGAKFRIQKSPRHSRRDNPPSGIVRSCRRGCDSLAQSFTRSSSRRGTVRSSPTDVCTRFISHLRAYIPTRDEIAWQNERQGTRAISVTFSSARHPRQSSRRGRFLTGTFRFIWRPQLAFISRISVSAVLH